MNRQIKKILNFEILKFTISDLLVILAANLLVAMGTNMFLISSDLYPTGVIGLSTEISQVVHNIIGINISYNVIYLIINIPLLIMGYFRVGKRFIRKTIFSVISFTVIAFLIPKIALIPASSIGDKLVPSIVGAIFMGLGTGWLLRIGASGGGTDIIAIYMSLYKNKSFGVYTLIINSFVIIIAILLSGDIAIGALSVINLYIMTILIDRVHNSQEKRVLLIITSNGEKVIDGLHKNLLRGITILNSQGAYNRSDSQTLIITISYGELYHALNVVRDADKKSFINVLKADNVVGNFENLYQKKL